MTIKKRGLGRGLEALLVDVPTDNGKVPLQTVAIDKFQQGNPLSAEVMNSDELQELAYAIIESNTVEPLLVRKIDDDHFTIIEGENRWYAAQLAGLQEIPVIFEEHDDKYALAMDIIANLQQENLNLLQEAEGLKQLLEVFEALLRQL